MPDRVAEPLPGHVVRLLTRRDDASIPPAELPAPPRLRGGARAVVAVIGAIFTAAGLSGVATLWIFPGPGLWFSLLFTLFLLVLVVAGWAAFVATGHVARAERRAADQWRTARPRIVAQPGFVEERHVALGDDGAVLGFTVRVAVLGRDPVLARWTSPRGASPLLQPQVPGEGARADVWLDPAADAAHPLVVDLADPTLASPG
ncbi:hypothetical protein GCM10027515_11560 [Schumannella luteola]|uniref:Uncharacterized protein n=1 Tax=Schumannella luteola TaxID=472059 RepID=A0A852Y8H2_9MICO|nr:hypothetical protein [Schumannella luteola]NYG97604.1 hypothetical protein [Schumannella luteola]TPX04659.1 hypothetical protein FJ656_10460 [Schumannella luteola]